MSLLSEMMEQKMKEREILTSNIEYDNTSFNNQLDNGLPITNTINNTNNTNNNTNNNTYINTYINTDEYMNDINIKQPNIDNIPRYFLESDDNQIEIKDTGCLECNPPIITFDYNFNDLYLPNNKMPITLKVKINKKEFEYPFVYKNEFISKRKYDERFESLDIPNSIRTETHFCKWTIPDGLVENMRIDDNYRYLTFAKYDDKLVFRQAKFRMIDDTLYKEQYGHLH